MSTAILMCALFFAKVIDGGRENVKGFEERTEFKFIFPIWLPINGNIKKRPYLN